MGLLLSQRVLERRRDERAAAEREGRRPRAAPVFFKRINAWFPRFHQRFLRPFEYLIARLRDRREWPRSWWFPIYKPVLFTNDADRLKYHDETSRALRRAVFSIGAYAFFCILTLAAPDAQVISATAEVKVPFANVNVSFSSFLFIGPLVLVGLLVYQHIFLAHLRLTDPPPLQAQLPILFNLPYRSARVISWVLFYWVGPIVLLAFTRKALPRPDAGLLFAVFALTTIWTLLLQIRRCPTMRRKIVAPILWAGVLILSVLVIDKVVLTFQGERISNTFFSGAGWPARFVFQNPFIRHLNLSGADLTGQDLSHFDLRTADLQATKLRNANLTYADLSGANLERADLTGADLRKANLKGVSLRGAVLDKARVR